MTAACWGLSLILNTAYLTSLCLCGVQVNSLSLKEERQDPLVRLADDAASV